MVAMGGPALDGSSNPSHNANRSGADATDSLIRPRAQRSSQVDAAGMTLLERPSCGVAMPALTEPSSSCASDGQRLQVADRRDERVAAQGVTCAPVSCQEAAI